MLITFFFHSSTKALLQTAKSTLIPLVLINNAVLLKPARIHVILSDGAAKEALTTITRVRTIMFASSPVATYCTIGLRRSVRHELKRGRRARFSASTTASVAAHISHIVRVGRRIVLKEAATRIQACRRVFADLSVAWLEAFHYRYVAGFVWL